MLAQKIKDSVIQYAFQGKLTERLASDSSVETLISEIGKENNCSFDTIPESEIPFEIPDEWKWVRWGKLSNSIQYGCGGGAQSSGNVKLVRISDINNNEIKWESVPFSTIQEKEIKDYRLNENDILFARTGGTVGKSVIVKNIPNDSNTYVFAGYLIRSNYNSKINAYYLKYFMDSQLYWNQLKSGTIGSAQPNCNAKKLANMILPLPPIEEQQRIVDIIDELMAKIDEYEKIENQLIKIKKDFPANMKDSILQAAMQGKLSEHYDSDSNSFEYLTKITNAVCNKKAIEKDKIEIPYENLPNNWEYTCIKNICKICTGKKDANFGNPSGEYLFFTCAKEPLRCKTYSYDMNAILLAGNGDIGNISIYNGKFEAYQRTYILDIDKELNEKFIYYAIKDRWIRYNKDKTYGTAIPYVRLGNLENYSIPFPPKEEQQRIVDLLDKLLPLCDELMEA